MEHIDNVYFLLLILLVFGGLYYYFMIYSAVKVIPKETFEVPAPAAIVKIAEPIVPPRDVSPSGPSPPNAHVSNDVAKENDVYNVIPNDPQDEAYGSQDIKDNLRYPERLFGPGVVNSGNKIGLDSEVSSKKIRSTPQPIQAFASEFVQNGALLDGVAADDTHSDPNYSSF